ncbi:MAG TPA: tetratricopeptide repeat protein [Verrucomicrobiae bacterium]|nr:tetratricopeptide repeat protein [Verrucomicrobiae bacterium]
MPEQAQDDLRITDQFDFEVFWEKHGKQITWVLIAVVALGLVVLYWQHQTAYQAEEAEARFAAARDVGALQAVARDFPGSAVAPEALARLAELYYRNGRYTEAASTYESIVRDYPRHPLGVSSRLGLGMALEAQGNIEGAKAQYTQIIGSDPTGYVAQAARMALGRCLEIQGQKKEARQIYEEILAGGQSSPWFEKAYVRMIILGRDLPPEKPEAPAANPSPAPASGGVHLPATPMTP